MAATGIGRLPARHMMVGVTRRKTLHFGCSDTSA
jgi:hypothetical protein